MSHNILNPLAVQILWWSVWVSVAVASLRSASTAWREASLAYPRRGLKFWGYWIIREQIAYAKLIPWLLGGIILGCAIIFFVPA